jgi:protease-4
MKKVLVGLLVALGSVVFLALVGGAGVGLAVWASKGRVPPKTILEADFETTPPVEVVPDDPIAQLQLGPTLSVLDVVAALERASEDPRVVGLVARVGGGMGLGTIQEVRDAVGRFRAKGKWAIAWSDTFGEAGPGTGAYYLATAFDTIYLQPSGDLGLTGLIFESPFLRGTLDKLGIVPRLDHRHEYKNAMNVFTEKKYTEPHREATRKVMDSWFQQIVGGIARARKMSEADVRSLMDRAPFFGQEALEAGLVDGLAYRDEVYEKAKEKAGKGSKLLYVSQYLKRAGSPFRKGTTVALIYGVGGVARGESEYDPVSGGLTMGSDTVAKAFRAAVRDKAVRAILFRVNSPGGSYVASDTIWRETVRARKAGKPVIVSMGDVAGSGGYFVAMACDKIVAEPATITGSIGVLGGKMLTGGFWDKLGVSWDEVHTSRHATFWTGTHDYSPSEWERFQAWLDRIYGDFTSKVAEGRRLPKERVLEIAKGRIWSGQDAKELGLVDAVGGYAEALGLVRETLGLPKDARIRLKVFPKKKSFFEALFKKEGESSEQPASLKLAARLLESVRPGVRLGRAVGLLGREEARELVVPLEPAVP